MIIENSVVTLKSNLPGLASCSTNSLKSTQQGSIWHSPLQAITSQRRIIFYFETCAVGFRLQPLLHNRYDQ